ncbi:putative ThiS protein [Shewanella benthica]|uniref:Putative ThiS protein n=1 Tax=Shewanella benthica TaxID=43661 RepID=A0A330M2V1_9GAMM|nr:sulfur carrier protein ThiS [Shewanella benthica]SQH76532.1 putative ThiS protein [Shewanella benthica]
MSHKISASNSRKTTIKVMLNDEQIFLSSGLNVPGLLQLQNIAASSVALVRNGQVLPKSRWKETLCRDGDQFEVFALVAGG